MKFSEVVEQARVLLQRKGRMTYRAFQREFELDDQALEDLKDELIEAAQVARDENGKVLVWKDSLASSVPSLTSQDTPLSDPRPQTLDSRRDAGERRQLTVMFIDLVGSTILSQQLDPEDYHARVVAYQTACQQAVAQYEGHIAQYLGDGVLVYFGYPRAHEDDAARAVRTGLEIISALQRLSSPSPFQGEGRGEGNEQRVSLPAPLPSPLPKGRGL